jgi:hypothetical protein
MRGTAGGWPAAPRRTWRAGRRSGAREPSAATSACALDPAAGHGARTVVGVPLVAAGLVGRPADRRACDRLADRALIVAAHVQRDRPDRGAAVAKLDEEVLQGGAVAARRAPHDRAAGRPATVVRQRCPRRCRGRRRSAGPALRLLVSPPPPSESGWGQARPGPSHTTRRVGRHRAVRSAFPGMAVGVEESFQAGGLVPAGVGQGGLEWPGTGDAPVALLRGRPAAGVAGGDTERAEVAVARLWALALLPSARRSGPDRRTSPNQNRRTSSA